MNLFLCFLFVVFDLISAGQLMQFPQHSKEEPVIRHNVRPISNRYDSMMGAENFRTLKMLEVQVGELKHLIINQGTILKSLSKDQSKLIKERDKNRKRNRFVKKYLKKIYQGCRCEAKWLDARNGHQGDEPSSEILSNVVEALSQSKMATVTKPIETNTSSVHPTTPIGEEHNGDFVIENVTEDEDTEDVVNDDVVTVVTDSVDVAQTSTLTIHDLPHSQAKPFVAETTSDKGFVSRIPVVDTNDNVKTTPSLTILDRPHVHTKQFFAEAAPGKDFVSRIPVVDNNDNTETTSKLTTIDRHVVHTKQFFAEAASGKGFVSRIPDADHKDNIKGTPTLTILDRPYVHTKQFFAEAASGKDYVSRIPVADETEPEYETRPENEILRDESKSDSSMMSPAGFDNMPQNLALPTKDGRTWPDVARYVMSPYTGEYDVSIDLALGRVTGNHSSIKILQEPLQGIAPHCIQQGVVKLAFGKPGSSQHHDAVLIDMTFDTPSQWVFNIGDSSTNDGRSGDSSKQENDCEVDGYGTTFSVYGSDKSPDPWSKLIYQKSDLIKERLTMVITDQVVVWNNFAGNLYFVKDASLFALKGQRDDQGSVNYDIFLGLNRVISGYYRSGRGLCTASLKWL